MDNFGINRVPVQAGETSGDIPCRNDLRQYRPEHCDLTACQHPLFPRCEERLGLRAVRDGGAVCARCGGRWPSSHFKSDRRPNTVMKYCQTCRIKARGG